MTVPPIAGDAAPAIQAVIDTATVSDCGEVLLAATTYEIKTPIQLRSHVRLSGHAYRHKFTTIRPTADFSGRALLNTDYDFSRRERKQINVTLEKLHLNAMPDCKPKQPCAPAPVGVFLEKTSYPTINECNFSGFRDGGAAVRGGGVLYLKVTNSRFTDIWDWSLDFGIEYAPLKPGTQRSSTYYAISVGTIEGNYFASRRGVRVEPGFGVTLRSNQFEGGLSMIHAFRSPSSVFAIEDNYFELNHMPQDLPNLGAIAVKGTGRIVGNLINGPVRRAGEANFIGPGIDIFNSEGMTIANNTIRCFDPGVRVQGTAREALTQFSNVIGPKRRVRRAWEAPFSLDQPAALGSDEDDNTDPNRLPLTSPDR